MNKVGFFDCCTAALLRWPECRLRVVANLTQHSVDLECDTTPHGVPANWCSVRSLYRTNTFGLIGNARLQEKRNVFQRWCNDYRRQVARDDVLDRAIAIAAANERAAEQPAALTMQFLLRPMLWRTDRDHRRGLQRCGYIGENKFITVSTVGRHWVGRLHMLDNIAPEGAAWSFPSTMAGMQVEAAMEEWYREIIASLLLVQLAPAPKPPLKISQAFRDLDIADDVPHKED